jgi:hypothetical protein
MNTVARAGSLARNTSTARHRDAVPDQQARTLPVLRRKGSVPVRRSRRHRLCGQCGAGVGLILIRKLKGWSYREACDETDRILREIAHRQPQRARSSSNDATLSRIERALADARAPEVVDAYLRRRGPSVTSPVLRGDAQAAIEKHLPEHQFRVLRAAEESERSPIRELVGSIGEMSVLGSGSDGGEW